LFLDDGGVMNDNALRGPQSQRLVGEFFPPLLGGTPEAWAEANGIVVIRQLEEYARTMAGRVEVDYAAFLRAAYLGWLGGMCELVGVAVPDEEECVALARRAAEYVIPRVRSAYPGAAEAIRTLADRGYEIHTASGEYSVELAGHLEGMGVRDR